MLTHVRKRDGVTLQPFDRGKIFAAVAKAWESVRGGRNDVSTSLINGVVDWVVTNPAFVDHVADVEKIQDVVEIGIMRKGAFDVAKHYVLYREKRAGIRRARHDPDPRALTDYIHPSKYAVRVRPDLGRRETYEETVTRVEEMHMRRFVPGYADVHPYEWEVPSSHAALYDLIVDAFNAVRRQEVLPSMRSMQFAGEAIQMNNARLYNCTASYVDRPRVFAETMWLLLSGCGVGYSVQFHHVEKLPPVARIDSRRVHHHRVGDTIEGWADALDALVSSYLVADCSWHGQHVEFDYSGVRGQGTPLRVSGGRAPGHLRLKKALEGVRTIFEGAAGRRLRPIEAHEVQCHSADAVRAGGIRRSAMAALFSIDDGEMMFCKTGEWHQTKPWLARSNNSVVLVRGQATRAQFHRIFEAAKQWGEPGFFFTNDVEYVTNPCFEIGLYPTLVREDGSKETGWAFCNLTETNVAKCGTKEDLVLAARRASVIGTLQAAYTDFPYLSDVTKRIIERDALIGVGLTGMMDSPEVAFDPEAQQAAAREVVEANKEVAKLIGINPAARTTTVKPGGTAPLELGGVASGIGPHHARRYIRRVVAGEEEVVFQHFKKANPHMCVRMPDGDWVVEFPIKAPDGAILLEDLPALTHLEKVRSTFYNWILPGTTTRGRAISPGLTHNVSNTIVVRPDEWDAVEEYLWERTDAFGAVSTLASSGDKDYSFAPREAIVTEADEARWNQLVSNYVPVDYSQLPVDDVGDLAAVAAPACEGDRCEVPQRRNSL